MLHACASQHTIIHSAASRWSLHIAYHKIPYHLSTRNEWTSLWWIVVIGRTSRERPSSPWRDDDPPSVADQPVLPYGATSAFSKSIFEHKLQHPIQHLFRSTWPIHMESGQSIHRLDWYATDGRWSIGSTCRGSNASIVGDIIWRSAHCKHWSWYCLNCWYFSSLSHPSILYSTRRLLATPKTKSLLRRCIRTTNLILMEMGQVG